METLLFTESPLLSLIMLYVACVNDGYIRVIFIILIIVFAIFYRYEEYLNRFDSDTIISPAEGTIQYIEEDDDYYCLGIYLDIFNRHYQVYPANGKVIYRFYDRTGKFGLVNYGNKSRDNEKYIHKILLDNGKVLQITQIAGFFPRVISSDDKINIKVKAGEYLGIIKLGSRVDIKIPKDFMPNDLFIGKKLHIGDVIGNIY